MVAIPFRHGTLDTPLRRAAMVKPDKVGLIDGEHQLTYRQLANRVGRLRGGLRSLGCANSDRVAAPATSDGRTSMRFLAGLRHDRDVPTRLATRVARPSTGNHRRCRWIAPLGERWDAVHRCRRGNPTPGRVAVRDQRSGRDHGPWPEHDARLLESARRDRQGCHP